MIQANELRVGNLVEWRRQHDIGASPEIVQIYNVELSSIRVYTDIEELPEILIYYDDVKPIPLTPEWLERAGFVKYTGNGLTQYINEYCWIYLVGDTFEVELITGDERWNLCRSYKREVHIFQNVMFFILGKELEFK